MLRFDCWIYLRVLNLKENLLLPVFVCLLLESIDWLAYFYRSQLGSRLLCRCSWLSHRIFCLSCRSSC